MPRGRKTKLTKEMIEKAAKLIAAGNYQQDVAQYLGVHVATWFRWLSEGEKQKSGIYHEFYEAIKKAKAEAIMRNVAIIQRAAQDGNWQAAAWWLERMYPEKFGRRDRVEHEGGVKIVVEMVEPDDGKTDQG